jgi:hypothetical protein
MYHAPRPMVAIAMITIASISGLKEKPIVRGTAAISPFGPPRDESFVLIDRKSVV